MANTHAHMTGLTRRRLLKTGIALSAATVTGAKADLTIGGQVISQPSQRYGSDNDADNMAFGEPNATPMTPNGTLRPSKPIVKPSKVAVSTSIW